MDRTILAYVRNQIFNSKKGERTYLQNFSPQNQTAFSFKKLGTYSMMAYFQHPCGSPSCIAGHTVSILPSSFWKDDLKEITGVPNFARSILGLSNKQAKDLFTPNFKDIAEMSITKGNPGFITKEHVLRCLDLILAGEEDVAKAWVISKPLPTESPQEIFTSFIYLT